MPVPNLLRPRSRRLGWLPDKPGEPDRGFDLLGLGSAALPATGSRLIPYFREMSFVLDQGNTNACVAHAFGSAIAVRDEVAHRTRPRASRLFMYWNARKFHGGESSDVGTYLRMCAKGLQRFGAPDEDIWPFRTGLIGSKVNRQPSWDAYSRAHPRRQGAYYRIGDEGAGRVLAVRAALAAGHPVTFGTRVGRSFLAAEGEPEIGVPEPGEEIAGGHAMCIVGCRPGEDGWEFRVLNSWGRAWRDNGLFWMSEEWLRWVFTNDLWIVVDGRPA